MSAKKDGGKWPAPRLRQGTDKEPVPIECSL